MGLDLALGAVVLFTAFRGWLKGFVVQAIRLSAIVAAVYAAGPLRDQIRPYVADHLPTLKPELTDRMLWWATGVGSYFLMVGLASLLVAVSRRQTFGISERNRGDQFAGFGLGLLKGLVVASFALSSLGKYAKPQLASVAWADEQWKTSYATKFDDEYHPAARIWAAPPVQQFVGHIQKMGLPKPTTDEEAVEEPKAVQTASRTPKLSLPQTAYIPPHRVRKPKLNLKPAFSTRGRVATAARPKVGEETGPGEIDTSGLDPDLTKALEALKSQLGSMGSPDGEN